MTSQIPCAINAQHPLIQNVGSDVCLKERSYNIACFNRMQTREPVRLSDLPYKKNKQFLIPNQPSCIQSSDVLLFGT